MSKQKPFLFTAVDNEGVSHTLPAKEWSMITKKHHDLIRKHGKPEFKKERGLSDRQVVGFEKVESMSAVAMRERSRLAREARERRVVIDKKMTTFLGTRLV